MRLRSILILAAALLLVTALDGGTSAGAQGRCLSQGEQRAEVRSGRVVRPGRIGRSLGGKLLRLRLCHGAGGLVWRVQVLQPDGRVRSRIIDARSGRPLR